MNKSVIYLDHAAATSIDERVLQVMLPYFTKRFYNPAANYGPARDVLAAIRQARSSVANHLGVQANEIIFTSGGTEANNLAVRGIMEQYPEASVLVSAIEHESVLEPAAMYTNHKILPVDEHGILKLETLRELIDDHTVLVSIMQANNEIGTLQPIRKASRIIKEARKDRLHRKIALPLYFHTDATQAANYLDLHAHRLGVDMMTLNGGKIYGPKGVGVLYVSPSVKLIPQLNGGGQQRGIRSGTENVAGAVGLSVAMDLAQNTRKAESLRLAELQELMIKLLRQSIPEVIINGSLQYRLPNNIHLTIHGQDNERILMLLDEKRIYAAAGSACSALSQASSHVLKAMGIDEADARQSLRFTLGRSTSRSEIKQVAVVLTDLLKPNS